MTKDLISVVMSNYNTNELFLRASIESILNQTYENFEFIIVDDCSTDNSVDVIESYNDKRIKLIKNKENMGLTKSLNIAIRAAKGEFIARMDADDISLPQRFEKQVEFLKQNPEYIACGTAIKVFGGQEKEKIICRTIPDIESFRIHLLFGNYPNIAHPTAMFNHSLLKKHDIEYDEKCLLAQDYKMWVNCSKYAPCFNINEVLLHYRVHGKAVSVEKQQLQTDIATQIISEQLEALHISCDDEILEIHRNFILERKEYNLKFKKWIKKLIAQNKIYKIYNADKLKKILWKRWAEISYFELAKSRNPIKIIRILANTPIKFWNILFKTYKNRHTKGEII